MSTNQITNRTVAEIERRFIVSLLSPVGAGRTAQLTGVLPDSNKHRFIGLSVATDSQGHVGYQDPEELRALVGAMNAGYLVDLFLLMKGEGTDPNRLASWICQNARLRARTVAEMHDIELHGSDAGKTEIVDAWSVRF